jgi:hypothetical protein
MRFENQQPQFPAPVRPAASAVESAPRPAAAGPRTPYTGPRGTPGPTPYQRGDPSYELRKAQDAGFFDPYLRDSFFDPIRSEQTAGSQARQRALLTATSLYGRGDPSLRGYAAIHGLMGEQGNLARILGAARAEQQAKQLQFFQDLLRDYAGVANRGGQDKKRNYGR